MNTIPINGQQYPYKVRARSIVKFEEEAGVSCLKLDSEALEQIRFTHIYSFVKECIDGADAVIDELEFDDMFSIFSELLSAKKQNGRATSPSSVGNATTTESLLESGTQQPVTPTPTSQSTSPIATSSAEREKVLSDISGEQQSS